MQERIDHLIQYCIEGKRHSQSRLYALLAPKMFVVCQRYAKSREEAEEILQEGFMKVFENLQQFKFTGSFEGWVRKIMVNCALQKCRSRSKFFVSVNIDDVTYEHSEAENISSRLSTKELLQLIQQLPPVYKLVFNLYVFEGMKHREIAALLGISEGTSKSNLSDARAILKKIIVNNAQTREMVNSE